MSDFTEDDRADWQQQADNERRMYEAELASYRADNPLWDRCRNHQERLSVDPLCYDKQYCRQCIEDRRANYADKPVLPQGHDSTGWQFGMDYPPSHYTEERK